jgi:hypothetical protein
MRHRHLVGFRALPLLSPPLPWHIHRPQSGCGEAVRTESEFASTSLSCVQILEKVTPETSAPQVFPGGLGGLQTEGNQQWVRISASN